MDLPATKKLYCYYHSQGVCTFGENCIYSHDRENSTEIPPDVCLFHLSSFCYHGTVCERRHLSVEQILSGNNVDDTVEPITDNETTIPSTKFLLPRFTQLSLRNVEDNCDGNASASTPKSYASAVCSNAILAPVEQSDAANKLLCSFFMSNGYCMLPDCSNVHGNLCDLCSYFALHPYNETERQKHRDECIKEHEKSMEVSFAFQRSKDLTCGICLEVVLEKESRKSSRFGILENCTHVYCIDCIRTWRNSKFEKQNKRGCPQCRIKSDFVIPSEYFYDDKTDKERLTNEYKNALSTKHCKYFNKGEGNCPFEGACFYKHEYPDGRKAELPMPSAERRRLKNIDTEYASILDNFFTTMEAIRELYDQDDNDSSDYEEIYFVSENV